MIIRLFCPYCAMAASKQLPHGVTDCSMPIAGVTDDGKYRLRCEVGHESEVILDNIKFELLFEMGLHALVDGHPHDAVSSFASALERFYEFFWHVALRFTSVSPNEETTAWKSVAKQSERQLGMFITAHLMLMKRAPILLNANTDVKFRNDVVHGGYIPTHEEACAFGNVVMEMINGSLTDLRMTAADTLNEVYKEWSPAPTDETNNQQIDDDELRGVVNILTAVDVRHPIKDEDDSRRGDVEDQFTRILRDRQPHRLELFATEEMRNRCRDRPSWS